MNDQVSLSSKSSTILLLTYSTDPTIFSFPSRHHPLPSHDTTTYKATFLPPTGLHPKLTLSLPASTLRTPKDTSTCALHAYWTLPTALFIDPYQLSDPLFLASLNLLALRSLAGAQDLEAPDWAIPHPWGSVALFELATPSNTTSSAGIWNITIPTHLRYLNSTLAINGKTPLAIPWPTVFWACEAEEGLKFATNPFDRVDLGFEGLFGPRTMFYHVPADQKVDKLVELLWVPVLERGNEGWVGVGTVLAVLVGFAWVCWRLVRGGSGKNGATKKGETKKEK